MSSTINLNKTNNFRANITVTTDPITFLVNGCVCDCLVYQPISEHLVGEQKGVTPGNIAKIPGAKVGQLAQVQINPKDQAVGNATVTY